MPPRLDVTVMALDTRRHLNTPRRHQSAWDSRYAPGLDKDMPRRKNRVIHENLSYEVARKELEIWLV